jgi:hypothetical protein
VWRVLREERRREGSSSSRIGTRYRPVGKKKRRRKQSYDGVGG